MSDATHAAVEAAIRAHTADVYDDPRIVTDWVILTANQGLDDDSTGYFYIVRPGMSAHVLTGLISHFLHRFEHEHSTEEDDEP